MDIQLGVHMLNSYWILKGGFGEIRVMVVMMTKHILQFTQQSFLQGNQGGLATTMYVHNSMGIKGTILQDHNIDHDAYLNIY